MRLATRGGLRAVGWRAATMVCAAALALACDEDARDPDVGATSDSAMSSVPLPAIAHVPLDAYVREGALAAGADRAETIARFGDPDSTTSFPVPNRHEPGVTDSVVTLAYDDGRYVFYVVTNAGRDILDLAEITSNEHLRHRDPGIGTSVDSLRAWFGAPTRTHENGLEYECATCEVTQPVTFDTQDGRVRRIRFDYYVD